MTEAAKPPASAGWLEALHVAGHCFDDPEAVLFTSEAARSSRLGKELMGRFMEDRPGLNILIYEEIGCLRGHPVDTERAGDLRLKSLKRLDILLAAGEMDGLHGGCELAAVLTVKPPLEFAAFHCEAAECLPPNVAGFFEPGRKPRPQAD